MINGITYGKGWAFLKQLYHLIGYDKFSLATQLYFERFQWKNTVLKDFLSCLDEADDRIGKKTLGLVISKWADTFLNTRGANVLEAKISEVEIKIKFNYYERKLLGIQTTNNRLSILLIWVYLILIKNFSFNFSYIE